MDEIIAELPWCCGEKDCPVQWHLSYFWLNDDGEYTLASYGDGDHDGCREQDVPDADEIAKAWDDYARDVVSTGNDPLGNYSVKYDRKERQAWWFWFESSPLGTVVTRAKRAGRECELTEIPERVCTFLGVDIDLIDHYPDRHPAVMPDGYGMGMGAVALHETGLSYGKWNRIVIEITVDRDAELVTRELRRLARRHLKATRKP